MNKLISLIRVFLFLLISITISWARDDSTISLSLPDLQWALELNLPGFDIKQKEVASRGNAARFHAENQKTGVIVSAFLEKAPRNGTSIDCRDFYWARAQKSPFKKDEIKQYEMKNMALIEYIVREYQGMRFNQKNINAYLAEDNYWIDIHLSKGNYQPEDDKLFESILETISIDRKHTASSYDNFYYGNIFYKQKEYKKAIPFFERALEQENRKAILGKDFFKIVVDLLGMSYGISGDLSRAKEIFQWAIIKEPEFPMFYYNLACVYAESDDMNGSIENLRNAYRYKDNMLKGEAFPDPSSDSSFSKYMTNRLFITELEKMKK